MSEEQAKGRLSLKLGQKRLFQQTLSNLKDHQTTKLENESQSRGLPSCCGLYNLGNTCYLNSILQVLRFCPGFCSGLAELHVILVSVLAADGTRTVDKKGSDGALIGCSSGDQERPLITHLDKLWQKMAEVEGQGRAPPVVDPTAFITKLKEEHPVFVGHMQQDAQEVLRFLLTSIQETCSELASSATPGSIPPSSRQILASDGWDDVPTLARKKCKLKGTGFTRRRANSMKPRKKQKLTAYHSLFGTADRKCSSDCAVPFSPKIQNGIVSDKLWSRKCDLIQETFQGMLAYQTRCFECDSCVSRTEAFLDVSLPVGSAGLSGFPACCAPEEPVVGNPAVGPFSLSWALSQFAQHERLEAGNKYWCDRCGHLGEAERSVLFASLPPVVTIHLNRFTTQAWGFLSAVNVRKVGGNIAIPATLRFKPWCLDTCTNKDRVYHLFAVVFHYGSTCRSGHYTTCVRAQECFPMQTQSNVKGDGIWFYFDDDRVEGVSQSELLDMLSPLSSGSRTAYILFYRTV